MSENVQAQDEQLPLQGVILCCTSISPEKRGTLAKYAVEMGAIHRLDLTSDVTHLLVGAIDTPKYRYVAKERPDIRVLLPDWVDAVRHAWMQADVVDIDALEEQWKAPALFGLKICVTGFDDNEQRNELQQAIRSNGGQYHGDLTKAVSHLIAREARGNKYEYAGQWGIKIVTLKWLRDSLDSGVMLEERMYHPLVPADEQGRGARTLRVQAPIQKSNKRQRAPLERLQSESGPRKLRRTASNRLGSQHEDLWANMGGGEVRPSQQTSGFEDQETSKADYNTNTFDESATQGGQLTNPSEYATPAAEPGQQDEPKSLPDTVFQNAKIHIHSFDARKTSILHTHLISNGAQILSEDDLQHRQDRYDNLKSLACDLPASERITFVLPHNIASPMAALSSLRDSQLISPQDSIHTDLWVEKCIFHKRYLLPSTPLCEPFAFPITGFESLTICPTSFTGIDLLHFSKAVTLVGAKYDETLRPETTVLVCAAAGAPNPEKLRYALVHDIPIVEDSWFYSSVDAKEVKPFGDFTPSRVRGFVGAKPNFHRAPQAHDKAIHRTSSLSATIRDRQKGKPPDPDFDPPKRHDVVAARDPFESSPYRKSSIAGPLRDLHPNSSPTKTPPVEKTHSPAKSPARQRTSPSAKIHSPPRLETSRSAPDAGLSGTLAALLASRRERNIASRASGSSADMPDYGTSVSRRHRKLGRATSNPSSLGSRPEGGAGGGGDGGGGTNVDISADAALESVDAGNAENTTAAAVAAAENMHFQPSQALSYEGPEARAAMEKLRKRIGAGVGWDEETDEGGRERVASIGTVSREAEGLLEGVRKRLRRR